MSTLKPKPEIEADVGTLAIKGPRRHELVRSVMKGEKVRLLLAVTLSGVYSSYDGIDQDFTFSVGSLEELPSEPLVETSS